MKIECLIKRAAPNYTTVEFGNALNRQVYKFEPVDKNDQTSPHVCEVKNQEHANRLLAILPRAYVELGQVIEEETTTQSNDPYSDAVLAEINPADATNDYLQKFAKEFLKINPKDKEKLRAAYLDQTEKELPESMTATAMIRECLILVVADAKEALAIATANQKNGF